MGQRSKHYLNWFLFGLLLVIFGLNFDIEQKKAELSKLEPPIITNEGNRSESLTINAQEKESTHVSESNTFMKERDTFTVVMFGVDNRPGESYLSNTDTIIIANLNRKKEQVAFLSIPRDTQVTIGNEINKINSAARLGGSLNYSVQVIENLIGQKADGFILTNFEGFKKVVDIVGGISVDVEKDMQFNTGDKVDGVINLKKGSQVLNGSEALQYVRFRNDALADISRTVRQQKVLKALASEMLKIKNIPKLPKLVLEINEAIQSDLSISDMINLSKSLININDFTIVSQTLPGQFVIEDNISYWKVDSSECKEVASNLFNQGETTSIFSGLIDMQAAAMKDSINEHNDQSTQKKQETNRIEDSNPDSDLTKRKEKEIIFEVLD